MAIFRWRTVALLVVFFVVYVLSIGPATTLVYSQHVQAKTMEAVYKPLYLLPGPCKQLIRTYMDWWK